MVDARGPNVLQSKEALDPESYVRYRSVSC